jgi:hypothetical protein
VGVKLIALVEKIRAAKGPFFVARIGLRVGFPLTKPDLPDSEEYIAQLLAASRTLGYDPLPPENK